MTADESDVLIKLFLFPGDLVCDLSGVAGSSDHRQVCARS